MIRLLTLSLLLITSLGFSQQVNKKLLGKWICCEKIELLNRFDNLTFVKDEAAASDKCIEGSCHYTRWNFEKNEEGLQILIDMYTGCKGAASNSISNTKATWSCDKKNLLTIFDEHFTKHIFEVTFTNTGFEMKRVK